MENISERLEGVAENTLIILNLGHLHIGKKEAKHIVDKLEKNTSVTTLNLSYNNLGSEGMRHIATWLLNNNTLTTLDVGGNNIGSAGARYIGEMLLKNTTLTTLDVFNNYIYDLGTRYIGKALKTNATLTTLNIIQYNRLTDPSSIEEGLKYNSCLIDYMGIRSYGGNHTTSTSPATVYINRNCKLFENLKGYIYHFIAIRWYRSTRVATTGTPKEMWLIIAKQLLKTRGHQIEKLE